MKKSNQFFLSPLRTGDFVVEYTYHTEREVPAGVLHEVRERNKIRPLFLPGMSG
jgi:hypothetical protein